MKYLIVIMAIVSLALLMAGIFCSNFSVAEKFTAASLVLGMLGYGLYVAQIEIE